MLITILISFTFAVVIGMIAGYALSALYRVTHGYGWISPAAFIQGFRDELEKQKEDAMNVDYYEPTRPQIEEPPKAASKASALTLKARGRNWAMRCRSFSI
jgi:hypothetical protein